jgi:molecular chaperone GrpE
MMVLYNDDAMKNKKQPPIENQESVQDEISMLKDQLLRVQAESDNFRKRSIQEKETTIKSANADLISSLLPVLDNFKRAANHIPASEDSTIKNWIIGVQAIERQLEETLKQFGISEIEATPKQEFNPLLHEAISHEPSDQPADTILQVTEIGYLLNGKVLRPAKVTVSAGK